MAITVGTSTSNIATAFSNQDKIVKTTLDKLVLFAYVDGAIKYKTSTDNGDTWDGSWTTVVTATIASGFDIYIDTNNDIFVVYFISGSSTKFIRMTYSAGTWSIGSAVTVSGSSTPRHPSITKRSNGDIWVTLDTNGANTNLYYAYSTDGGASFTSTTVAVTGIGANYFTKVMPHGSDIWVIVGGSTLIKLMAYDGATWTNTTIASSLGNVHSGDDLDAIRIDDNNIWVARIDTNGIKVWQWTGSWSASNQITDNTSDISPNFAIVNSQPVMVWRDYDGANYDISYRKYNGSSWDAQVDLTTGATVEAYPTLNNIDNTWLYVGYTSGGASPYDIIFDRVNLNPTVTKTILSDAKIKIIDIQNTLNSDAKVVDQYQKILNSDSLIRAIDVQKTILSDSKIKAVDISKTILSDAVITSIVTKTIESDAKIKVLGEQKNILSDATIKITNIQESILSDAKILVIGEQKTILSDSKIVILALYDIINKFNSVLQVLSDISNKVNTVIRVLSDVNNFINTCKAVISDIANDIRTKKLTLNNITNDVRFIYRWQNPTTLLDTYWTKPGTSNDNVGGGLWRGQTFTPLNSGTLIKLVINIDRAEGGTSNLFVEIQETTNDKPNGTVLATETIPYATIPEETEGAPFSDTEIIFSSPPTLRAGRLYAFVVHALGSDNFEYELTVPGSGYSGGRNCASSDSGVTWTLFNSDTYFKTYIQKTNLGFQSLGKEYITVYINSTEQTDVDVDSINISKDLNTAHTATFDLGRAYDSTKPDMEAIVEIKYNDWLLYKGYITDIAPSEDPEKIRINCKDEYWKQNKSNVYYHVGHEPKDNKELYYETLAEALIIQHSWTPGIGNFVPQTKDIFAIGKSDAITNLITECGNYGWFYDVDGTKKLWTAGEGTIIDLDRQILGTNIQLYNVINHSFEESVEDIVNKFRVQMGEKVIRKFNTTGGSRTYSGYNFASYHQFVEPAWDRSLELLSTQTVSGYGFDHRNPAYSNEYSKVFAKYYMPYLNSELSSWSDIYPPYVVIYNIGTAFGFVGWLNLSVEQVLTEGFTIDYENATITFNDPMFLYQTDANGECIDVRAPIVKVFLWKKNYYTFTADPSEDPETDVSNPLLFFTDKMGDYTDTIIKDLNLSNLSIQEGGQYYDTQGVLQIIPSWDDTDFAKDLANWELSKNCDKKITGTVEITLDALYFYNIDLTKRIYIDGITEDAMNISSINYNLANFTVRLTLENNRYYKRTVSYQSHGE